MNVIAGYQRIANVYTVVLHTYFSVMGKAFEVDPYCVC